MSYIVFDLEWNQSNSGQEPEIGELPFEVIEIGAVKLGQGREMISGPEGEDTFQERVSPVVYRQMHYITGRLIHMDTKELRKGRPFPEVVERFLAWCGEDPVFCTWGPLDLAELQRNMRFHEMEPLSRGPIAFLDVQKLFSLAYEDGKSRRALEYAVDFLKLEKDIPFHRAFSDAYFTAKVFAGLEEEILKNVSYDIFNPPLTRKDEIKIQFDGYVKYISRQFEDKNEAMADHEVTSTRCYLCRRNLRKKIRWFSPNGKNYYCVAFCQEHGYLKGKIRLRRADNGMIYAVKTTKLIPPEDVEGILEKRSHMRQQRRRHRKKAARQE